eukprot:scaffold1211_cov120-Isochrysis_galbana.AAC.2
MDIARMLKRPAHPCTRSLLSGADARPAACPTLTDGIARRRQRTANDATAADARPTRPQEPGLAMTDARPIGHLFCTCTSIRRPSSC